MPPTIDRVITAIGYAEFLDKYLIPNRPLLVGSVLARDWPAFHLWIDDENNVDWDYLSIKYGSLAVSATDCVHGSSEPCTSELSFREVIDKWRNHDEPAPLLYVKDWHLARWVAGKPDVPSFYETPGLFVDDWLNYYYCNFADDDFRFVYIGVEGTFTSFHKDVYDSYSWSTNIFGRKLWTFWAPDDGERSHEGAQIIQEPGETMFVPSGWYHTVKNLTTCISINHNWCNSVNLPSMYNAICRRIIDVERELEDVRELLISNAHSRKEGELPWETEWMTIVQDVLEKDAGWNWSTFWQMVLHGLQAAMQAQSPNPPVIVSLFPPPAQHLQPPFDLVKRNVQYCYANFCKRQRDECKGEFDLQIKGDDSTPTLRQVFKRLANELEECCDG